MKVDNISGLIYGVIFATTITIGISTFDCNAQSKWFGSSKKTEKTSKSAAEELYDLTFEENLTNLKLGKYSERISEYQKNQALSLKKKGYKTEVMRNGEIVIVTIPAESLFLSMDSNLKPDADVLLLPIINMLKVPDFYRVLIVMHSDNTGSESFKKNITKSRIEAVFNWYQNHNANTDYLIPYAMGDTSPITDNNSMDNRKTNRRLEIYLVPGSEMVNRAKKKTLQFISN